MGPWARQMADNKRYGSKFSLEQAGHLHRTHRVPGHDVEVQLRRLPGMPVRYAVRTLEVRERPAKDDWRQVGTEVTYDDYEAARTAANARWTELRDGDWRRTT